MMYRVPTYVNSTLTFPNTPPPTLTPIPLGSEDTQSSIDSV